MMLTLWLNETIDQIEWQRQCVWSRVKDDIVLRRSMEFDVECKCQKFRQKMHWNCFGHCIELCQSIWIIGVIHIATGIR